MIFKKKDLRITTDDLLDDLIYEWGKYDPHALLEYQEDAIKVIRAIGIIKEYSQGLCQNDIAEINERRWE